MTEKISGFIEELTGERLLRVQDDLGDGFVRLRAAEAQRRQAKQDIRSFEDVVIELLRNARDAQAHAIFVACWKNGSQRNLTMLDDGKGIPSSHHSLVFEPFVTSKLDSFHADRWGVHGRGMALYSIKENTDDAHILCSEPGQGSVFSVRAEATTLHEKKDQSSLPQITMVNGIPVLRGPHNILRTVLEFSIDERNSVVTYLGSPTEIAATLYDAGTRVLDALTGTQNDTALLPLMYRLACANDPREFRTTAESIGLPMSERSARRILDGEIDPLKPTLSLLMETDTSEKGRGQKSRKPKPRLTSAQRTQLASKSLEAYAPIAQELYLDDSVEPRITVTTDALLIRIPLVSSDESTKTMSSNDMS